MVDNTAEAEQDRAYRIELLLAANSPTELAALLIQSHDRAHELERAVDGVKWLIGANTAAGDDSVPVKQLRSALEAPRA